MKRAKRTTKRQRKAERDADLLAHDSATRGRLAANYVAAELRLMGEGFRRAVAGGGEHGHDV